MSGENIRELHIDGREYRAVSLPRAAAGDRPGLATLPSCLRVLVERHPASAQAGAPWGTRIWRTVATSSRRSKAWFTSSKEMVRSSSRSTGSRPCW